MNAPTKRPQNALDAAYLEARKTVSAKVGQRELWNVIDHWPLYVGVRNLARYLSIYEIVKEFASVPGDIAEFGSWCGANLMFMAKVLQITEPQAFRRLHCFDSFEGLTTFDAKDGDQSAVEGKYKGSREELEAMIDLYELTSLITINVGDIGQTLPAFLTNDPGAQFSLIYFDADLYSPAITTLTHCHPHLAKGGAFVFDEWGFANFPGEAIAVREFMTQHGDSYEMRSVRGSRQPSLVLRKVR